MEKIADCDVCLKHTGIVSDIKHLYEKVNSMEKIGIGILVALVANFLGVICTLAVLLAQ